VTNYGELADKLKDRRSTARSGQDNQGINAAQVYERVKALVDHEIEKANVALRQRKLASIERLFLPTYHGRLCLSFGSELLCTVDLQEARGQITAVISGPPNAAEISRKEFPLGGAYGPEQIAVEIVSGLLMGEFS
jgi:hypothetical protein